MFWVLHGRTKTRVVPGGHTLEDRCPACGKWAVFHEVEVTTSAGAFFVIDVASATDRGYRCSACAEVLDLRDDGEPGGAEAYIPASRTGTATPMPAPKPPRDLLAERERERAARAASQARRDASVEDELAALKRKLGK